MTLPFRLAPLSILATLCFAQDVTRMDQIAQSYLSNKQYMGSVLVARNDDVLFSKGYGSANLEWNIPNTPSTKFRLGSLTKQFTAACILLLEERGKLKVEDPIKKYMPDAPAAWDKITIYNLLTHTAGIPNFTGLPEYSRMEPFNTPPEKIVGMFRDKPLDFEPGERMSYSNSGYVVLGYLIEKITGASYEKFVQENIFGPLGMKDSGYDSNTVVISRRASGYSPSPAGLVNAGFVHMSIPFSAGALYSTTEDLLRWEQGLFDGKLLSEESLKKMTMPNKSDYAFGLISRTTEGHKQIWHNGGIEGFNTSMAYYPDSKICVIVLANVNGPAADQMLAQLAAIAHGQTVQLTSERKEIAVPRQTLSAYVGTYQLTPQIRMMITLDGQQLMTQLSGQGKLAAFPEMDKKFFLKAVDAQLEFVADNTGAVTGVILHQGGRDQLAKRVSDAVAERKEISVAQQILSTYTGSYELRQGMDAVVTLEDGKLMIKPGAQAKAQLFPETETTFFLKVVDAQVEFIKDGNDAVTSLVLHQGPANIKAPRK
jgi:CubicO group peptidase (beta-lactamase class C family)